MIKRLNATLNFICTYEKVVTINNTIVDVIEEFNIKDNQIILHGYNDTYKFVFSNFNININNTHVGIDFFGDIGGSIHF